MHIRIIFTLFALTLFNTCLFAQLPENYQDIPAEQKQDFLWGEINHSHQKNPLPKLNEKSLKDILATLSILLNLNPTFDHSSDEMPTGRIKIIHANGSVGKILLQPSSEHPFTGIYQTGAIGLARLSVAAKPTDKSYIPGMAIKLLVPHHSSLNLHVMNCLEGQQANWNYFEHDFSNHIDHAKDWTLKAIEKIFEWTKNPANDLPLMHLASFSDQGDPILNPIAPERIYFRPSESVKNIIPADSREDFRTSFLQIPLGPLYEIYGDYQGKEYHIGTLVLESTILASDYGDKTLFFQHQR